MQRGAHFDLSDISDCDPDAVEDFVLRRSRLDPYNLNPEIVRSRWSDLWHMFFQMRSAEETLAMRRKQIMQLARYGRQSIFEWDDVSVDEVEEWIETLSEIIKAENATGGTEDH